MENEKNSHFDREASSSKKSTSNSSNACSPSEQSRKFVRARRHNDRIPLEEHELYSHSSRYENRSDECRSLNLVERANTARTCPDESTRRLPPEHNRSDRSSDVTDLELDFCRSVSLDDDLIYENFVRGLSGTNTGNGHLISENDTTRSVSSNNYQMSVHRAPDRTENPDVRSKSFDDYLKTSSNREHECEGNDSMTGSQKPVSEVSSTSGADQLRNSLLGKRLCASFENNGSGSSETCEDSGTSDLNSTDFVAQDRRHVTKKIKLRRLVYEEIATTAPTETDDPTDDLLEVSFHRQCLVSSVEK